MKVCRTAICAGTFDPPTDGHINIVERGLKVFDKIVVAVAINTHKKEFFSANERVEMLQEIFKDYDRVEIDSFEGLLVNYARKRDVTTILRGIRNMSDYEYESQMALANKTLYPDMEIMYMMTEGKYAHISSSIIKEVMSFGGDGCGMVHPVVEKKVREKIESEKRK